MSEPYTKDHLYLRDLYDGRISLRANDQVVRSRNQVLPPFLSIGRLLPSGPVMGQRSPFPLLDDEIVVPQIEYKSRDKKFVAQYPPTFFNHKAGGMPLREAQDGNYEGLHDESRSMFDEFGATITMRLQIEGHAPADYRIRVKDNRKPPKPITLGKLSTEVARSMKKFIKKNQHANIPSECSLWRVGPEALTLDCFILQSLVQVSARSFQPRLILNKDHPYVLTGWHATVNAHDGTSRNTLDEEPEIYEAVENEDSGSISERPTNAAFSSFGF